MSRGNRSRLVFATLSGLVVVPLLSGAMLSARPRDDADDSLYKYLSVFTEVLRLVRTAYVEEPELDRLMAGAMDGAADALDPFSMYVPASQVEEFDRAERIGRRHHGLLVLKERGVAFVAAVDVGSPAERAGIRRGDIVAKLNDRSTRDMPMWELRQTLAGPAGSTLAVELVRQASPLLVDVELGPFPVPAPSVSELGGRAVVRVPGFDDDTSSELAKILRDLGPRPILLDLRGVAGGNPKAAYRCGGLFVPGNLGRLEGRRGVVETFEGQSEPAFVGEVALLVDRGSQGAAEVFSAVLVQGAGAVLVGETTFGHAGRSERLSLQSGGFLELTRAFYTGPDGKPLVDGLEPELVVRRRFFDEEASEDEVLKGAIELLEERAAGLRKAA